MKDRLQDEKDRLKDKLLEERDRLKDKLLEERDRKRDGLLVEKEGSYNGLNVISTGSGTTYIRGPSSGDIISANGSIITSSNGHIISTSTSGTGQPKITTIPSTGSWSCNASGCHMMTPAEKAETERKMQAQIDATNAKVKQTLDRTKATVAAKLAAIKTKYILLI